MEINSKFSDVTHFILKYAYLWCVCLSFVNVIAKTVKPTSFIGLLFGKLGYTQQFNRMVFMKVTAALHAT
jgi:hypothetical protein